MKFTPLTDPLEQSFNRGSCSFLGLKLAESLPPLLNDIILSEILIWNKVCCSLCALIQLGFEVLILTFIHFIIQPLDH